MRDEEKARMGQVYKLQKILLQGNRMFAGRYWTSAIDKYSHCIDSLNLAGGAVHVNHDKGDENLDELTTVAINTVLALSYSSRAKVRLQLRDYKEALDDTEEALKVYPYKKHVKSLVRQGKAAHGLELYQKACEAYKLALEESPEEKSIVNLLKKSTLAVEQSREGRYNFGNFYTSGDTPSCADYVGPVIILRYGVGERRGLFATKNLEPDELLFVSNPLAAERGLGMKVGHIKDPQKISPEKAIAKILDTIKRSNLQMHRMMFLADDDLNPPMELFILGSGLIPPGGVDGEPDLDFIRRIQEFAIKNMFHYPDVYNGNVTGVWILPAFAKRELSPNSRYIYVGDTLFFCASGRISEGEAVTVSCMLYFSTYM